MASGPVAVEVLLNRRPAVAVELPSQAKAGSGVVGTLNGRALSSGSISITLADSSKLDARVQRVVRDDKRATQSWIGTFDGMPGSVFVLSKTKGAVAGFANVASRTFEITPTKGGSHVLYEVDSSRLPKLEDNLRPQLTADGSASSGAVDLSTSTLAAAEGLVVQDLLVLYTAASASRHGQAALESMIRSAVESANQAYANSQANLTLNLVALQQTSLTEASDMNAMVDKLQVDATVARLRDQLGADIVMLVSENSDYCGLANLMTSNSTSFAPYAFGVANSGCMSYQVMAHEIGHIQGLMHDRDSSPYGGVYSYSYGYRMCVSGGFRDIMSYQCSGGALLLNFSNPSVYYNGYPTGVSYDMSPGNAADNARSLNNTAATVAAFKASASGSSSTTTPAAPTNLAMLGASYQQVSLSWSDNATNESGYKLERSTDGVNFSELASLGADARNFVDTTVSPLTTYYYRVRAFNSSGASAYSGIVSVRTPDVPPPPPATPTSVSASDNADGSATVQWAPSSSNAASFEVTRETWDARKSVWGRRTVVATVPANLSSIVDLSGNGTFRYFVRATNDGGASAQAGPSQTTVTGAAKAGKRRR